MLDAAIIGLGWWGKNIVNSVQARTERLRFVRGVSKEPDTVRDFAAHHDFELSTDLNDALNDPRVQAVVLATPHSLHTEQIIASAAAGKAVFCEKPLAMKKADAMRSVAACNRAGVVLGIGTNKRFWPSMRELRKVVASGVLGDILHIEGHYSNENSGMNFSPWRDLPSESPGGGMTGAGLHVLDALVNLGGPMRRIYARLVTRKPQPDPHDSVSVMFEYASGISGMFATVRASPFIWRVHVIGRKGSVEAVGENEIVVRLTGAKPKTQSFEPVDTMRVEFEVFADAVAGRATYPIPTGQMIAAVAAFEAIIKSIDTDSAVLLDAA